MKKKNLTFLHFCSLDYKYVYSLFDFHISLLPLFRRQLKQNNYKKIISFGVLIFNIVFTCFKQNHRCK